MNDALKTRLLEKLAALEHARWSHWMKYLFTKGKDFSGFGFYIHKDSVERWKRQLATEYKDLSEAEKESDRVEARKTLEVLEAELLRHQAGCLLPDGHEGPCVEAVWKKDPMRLQNWVAGVWTAWVGDWLLDVYGDGRWRVHGPFGEVTGGRVPLSPDAEEARRRAEDCLRKLLTVPGITLTVR